MIVPSSLGRSASRAGASSSPAIWVISPSSSEASVVSLTVISVPLRRARELIGEHAEDQRLARCRTRSGPACASRRRNRVARGPRVVGHLDRERLIEDRGADVASSTSSRLVEREPAHGCTNNTSLTPTTRVATHHQRRPIRRQPTSSSKRKVRSNSNHRGATTSYHSHRPPKEPRHLTSPHDGLTTPADRSSNNNPPPPPVLLTLLILDI